MELLPTLPTHVGMILGSGEPRYRHQTTFKPPPQWTFEGTRTSVGVDSVYDPKSLSANDKKRDRFPKFHDWGIVPQLLAEAYTNRLLPLQASEFAPQSQGGDDEDVPETTRWRLAHNLVEIDTSVDLAVLKSMIVNRQRIDIEQAVGLVLRALPEHAAELIPLVPTIMTKSRMWLETPPDVYPENTDARRRRHLVSLLVYAHRNRYGLGLVTSTEKPAPKWHEIAGVLLSVRRNRPADLTRGLRLPEWLRKHYYNGSGGSVNEADTSRGSKPEDYYPSLERGNAIVVSKRDYMRLTRYVWKLVPEEPEKVLRRDIQEMARTMVYAEDRRATIERAVDTRSVAYTFIAAQRRMQMTVVSDLRGMFLEKGQASRIQQNTPNVQTSFEAKLGEIALRGGGKVDVDWAVLTAIQRPKGVEGVDSVEDLLGTVDRVCEAFERYVMIYGDGHTEKLRPKMGRKGGYRGPVDDWNAAVDVLRELRRKIEDAGYGLVEDGEDKEDGGFTVVGEIGGVEKESGWLPQGHKFLALDIMGWNNSWGDDAFALEKMPPDWWVWLKRRGKRTAVVVDYSSD